MFGSRRSIHCAGGARGGRRAAIGAACAASAGVNGGARGVGGCRRGGHRRRHRRGPRTDHVEAAAGDEVALRVHRVDEQVEVAAALRRVLHRRVHGRPHARVRAGHGRRRVRGVPLVHPRLVQPVEPQDDLPRVGVPDRVRAVDGPGRPVRERHRRRHVRPAAGREVGRRPHLGRVGGEGGGGARGARGRRRGGGQAPLCTADPVSRVARTARRHRQVARVAAPSPPPAGARRPAPLRSASR